jgi:heme-degrading monooxygenase HmoA
MDESTIRADAPLVTMVNVFTVEPENQRLLVERWQRATEEVIRHLPGFVSANIHRSLDGTKVVNYAQWETREALTAMLQNPAVLAEVVSVHHA